MTDLKVIKARADNATPGPWSTREYEGEYCDEEDETRAWWLDGPDWVDREDEGLWLRERDATFIAHSRTDIPALLADLAVAQEVVTHALRWKHERGSLAVLQSGATPTSDFLRALTAYEEAQK